MKLVEYLKEKHLTTEAFAALIGVDRTTVGRWLGPDGNGKVIRPRWDVMDQIAAVTGGQVMPNDFMEDLPELIEGFGEEQPPAIPVRQVDPGCDTDPIRRAS